MMTTTTLYALAPFKSYYGCNYRALKILLASTPMLSLSKTPVVT